MSLVAQGSLRMGRMWQTGMAGPLGLGEVPAWRAAASGSLEQESRGRFTAEWPELSGEL